MDVVTERVIWFLSPSPLGGKRDDRRVAPDRQGAEAGDRRVHRGSSGSYRWMERGKTQTRTARPPQLRKHLVVRRISNTSVDVREERGAVRCGTEP